MSVEALFSPWDLAGLTLPNRLVMAPLTRMRASADGVLGEMHAEYYAQRASAGLIISEGIFPHHAGKSYPGQPGLETPEQVDGLRLVTDAVHRAGGRIFAQVMHGGRISHPRIIPGGLVPVAPSAVQPDVLARITGEKLPIPVPRALEPDELGEVQEQFAGAAENAVAAGFDGIELHGANGYLLHQFISDVTNLRDDGYGGDAAGRTRFVVETARLCAERIGADRVGIRISPDQNANDISETDSQGTYPMLLDQLARIGIAYVHVMETPPDAGWSSVDLARSNWPSTLVANSNFLTNWEPEEAAAMIADGRADLCAYGRRFIANPDLVERIRAGASLNEADPKTFYGGGREGYTDYPTIDKSG